MMFALRWSPSGGVGHASDPGYVRCPVGHVDGIQVKVNSVSIASQLPGQLVANWVSIALTTDPANPAGLSIVRPGRILLWWRWADLNRRHHDYESCALTS
jgi:hypothetical protein